MENVEKILSEDIKYKYDDRGNRIYMRREWGSYDKKWLNEVFYTYNKNNQLVYSIRNIWIGEPDEYSAMKTYIYDNSGVLMRTVLNNFGQRSERYENPKVQIEDYVYDQNGKLIKRICQESFRFDLYEYDDDLVMDCKREYEYNSKDQKESENILWGDGDEDKYKYKYNKNNQLVCKIHDEYDDGEWYKNISYYTYDNSGRLIKERYCIDICESSWYYSIIYEYNNTNQLMRELKYKEDDTNAYEETLYKYNDNGQLIHKYTYEYKNY